MEPKWLHSWSHFMVFNSAPPMTLFWRHFQNMIINKKNGSTLQSGTVFQNSSTFFLSACLSKRFSDIFGSVWKPYIRTLCPGPFPAGMVWTVTT